MIVPMATTISRSHHRGGGHLRSDCSPDAQSERTFSISTPQVSALVPLLSAGDVASGIAVFAVGVAILIIWVIVAHYLTKRAKTKHTQPKCEAERDGVRCTEPGEMYWEPELVLCDAHAPKASTTHE